MRAETLCAPIVSAVVNGVYQGLLLTVLVWLLLRLLPRTNAATRHAVWFVSLALVAVIVPGHYWLRHTPATAAGRVRIVAPSLPTSAAAPLTVLPEPGPLGPMPFADNLPGMPDQAAPEDPLGPLLLAVIPQSDSESKAAMDPGRVVGSFLAEPDLALQPDRGWFWQHPLQPVPLSLATQSGLPVAGILVALWLSVAALRLTSLALRLARLGKLTQGATRPDARLEALFEHLRAAANVNRPVSLRVSQLQRTPLVMGFLRPVVLIPADLAAQPDLSEARHVLAHELAHVRRYDDWANLFQHLVQAVLFFHPSVWWINSKLSLEREIACDDHALLHSGGPRHYALVLANVAKRISQRAPRLAPGVWNSNSQLQQRISMILNTRRNSSPVLAKARLAWIVTATVGVGIAALQIGPRVVFAESPAHGPVVALTPTDDSPGSVHAVGLSSDAPGGSGPAVISLVAQSDTPGVDPGPKFKSDSADVAPEAPEPPATPNIEVDAPTPPHVARLSKPGKTPRPPESPDNVNDGDSSLEQRVRRLEKMVRGLAEQQKIKHAQEFSLKDGSDKQMFGMDQQEMERMKAGAERQAQRAAEQAQRAAEQAKRATKDLQARLSQDQGQGQGQFREALQRQLEALRKAREGLGQEMERLSRQIEKLEKEQQHSDKDRDRDREKDQQRRSEASSEKLQAQADPTTPATP